MFAYKKKIANKMLSKLHVNCGSLKEEIYFLFCSFHFTVLSLFWFLNTSSFYFTANMLTINLFLLLNLFFCLQNLKNWHESDLKNLLDEAISYKRPKDRENKSQIFKVSIFCFFNFKLEFA